MLVEIKIIRDYNADGRMTYLVTPLYRYHGRLVSVPDDRGFPTLAEAEAFVQIEYGAFAK